MENGCFDGRVECINKFVVLCLSCVVYIYRKGVKRRFYAFYKVVYLLPGKLITGKHRDERQIKGKAAYGCFEFCNRLSDT